MRALSWNVYFRAYDLDVPTVVLGRYEQKPLADKIAALLQHCTTEGSVLVERDEQAVEPS